MQMGADANKRSMATCLGRQRQGVPLMTQINQDQQLIQDYVVTTSQLYACAPKRRRIHRSSPSRSLPITFKRGIANTLLIYIDPNVDCAALALLYSCTALPIPAHNQIQHTDRIQLCSPSRFLMLAKHTEN
jgi:hypothetical protein